MNLLRLSGTSFEGRPAPVLLIWRLWVRYANSASISANFRYFSIRVRMRAKKAFAAVRSQITQDAPIALQARKAAEIFRREFGWEHGNSGIGDLLRPNLRRAGLVIVESPRPGLSDRGLQFSVRSDREVACVFANSYQSTWFRRNAVILHEACHGIFDLEGDPVSIDYKNETSDEVKRRPSKPVCSRGPNTKGCARAYDESTWRQMG